MPAAPSRGGIAALIVLSLVWGYTWVAMKEAVRFADPFDFSALRAMAGALLMFGAMVWLKKPLRLQAPGRTFVFGLFQTTGFNALAAWALYTGAAGKTAVLVYTLPFWTLLIAWPLLGERLRGLQWPATVLAAAGLLLVLEPWQLAGTTVSKLLALATALSWAISAVLAKKWRNELQADLLALTAWQMLMGGAVLTVIALSIPTRPIQWTPYFWVMLIYCTLAGSVAGWLLWLFILRRLAAGIAGLSIMAVPALGVLFARLQLAERPGIAEAGGMLLIGASLALLSWHALRSEQRVTTQIAQK
ncbi:MAG: EamA family transporter [Betaproteobacteria bacterium]|nr:MAG: EamA family transporter [Betaproteobacteria bacterium]